MTTVLGLYSSKWPLRQEPANSKIVEIGKEIVANCGGIPFAITTIGGILRFKKAEAE